MLVFSSDVTLRSKDIPVGWQIRYQSVLSEHNQLERCFVTGNGLKIDLPVLGGGTFLLALISCTVRGSFEMYLAISLMRWNTRFTGLCGGPMLVSDVLRAMAEKRVILVRHPPISGVAVQPIVEIFKIDKRIASTCEGLEVSADECFVSRMPPTVMTRPTASLSPRRMPGHTPWSFCPLKKERCFGMPSQNALQINAFSRHLC